VFLETARNRRGRLALAFDSGAAQAPRSEGAMPEHHDNQSGGQIVKTATEARAAQGGTGLRWVLIAGTIGVAVIFALLWLYDFT
jgi:hypothetical protein